MAAMNEMMHQEHHTAGSVLLGDKQHLNGSRPPDLYSTGVGQTPKAVRSHKSSYTLHAGHQAMRSARILYAHMLVREAPQLAVDERQEGSRCI